MKLKGGLILARLNVRKMREERISELEEQIEKATYKRLWNRRKQLVAEKKDLENKLEKYKE